MIKRIYQIADVHIPTYNKKDMYYDQLQKLIDEIRNDVDSSGLDGDEIRIVICGDLVNSKNQVTNELYDFTSYFIRALSSIAKVICIAGNHDLIESNTSRTDTLTGIFHASQFENAYFIDEQLDYCSGVVNDDNVIWALYSFYDGYCAPDIYSAKKEHPESTVFGLYHGQVVGTKLYNGTVAQDGQGSEIFDGCDYVLAGHIHKRQEIDKGNCKIVYSGSVIQKDYGETVSEHGYAIWELTDDGYDYRFVDLPSEYGYYKISINSIDDIKKDKEVFENE